MTGDQAREVLAVARAQIEAWKVKLLPVAGPGAIIEGRTVTLTPAVVPAVVTAPTYTMVLWVQVTMTQAFHGEEPSGYEDATFEYEPRLVKQIPDFTGPEYEWAEDAAYVLPLIIAEAPQAGEFIPGKVWSGEYDDGAGTVITDLVKEASVRWYLLMHRDGQAVTFATGLFAGQKTLRVQTRSDPDFTGDLTSPRDLRMSSGGTVDSVTALTGSGGDTDTAQVYELLSISRR